MEYFIKSFDSVVHSKQDSAEMIYSGNGISVECFHLKENTSILENEDNPSYSEGETRTVCYLVAKGSLEFWRCWKSLSGTEKSLTVLIISVTPLTDDGYRPSRRSSLE